MSLDWSSDSLAQARDAQERHGWDDEQLVRRMEGVLRGGSIPDIARDRDRLVADYDALPAATTTTERIEHLARVLPALSGPWATVFLADLLARATEPRPRAASPRAGGPPPPSYDARADWRRGLLIMGATVLALVVLAILRLLLR